MPASALVRLITETGPLAIRPANVFMPVLLPPNTKTRLAVAVTIKSVLTVRVFASLPLLLLMVGVCQSYASLNCR